MSENSLRTIYSCLVQNCNFQPLELPSCMKIYYTIRCFLANTFSTSWVPPENGNISYPQTNPHHCSLDIRLQLKCRRPFILHAKRLWCKLWMADPGKMMTMMMTNKNDKEEEDGIANGHSIEQKQQQQWRERCNRSWSLSSFIDEWMPPVKWGIHACMLP